MKQQYYVESVKQPAFIEYFSKIKKQVDSGLSKFVSSLIQLDMYSEIKYAVLSEGKRFRPFLVILSADSVGRKQSKIMPLALAFELMHTATLVHDDIIDKDEMRRGKPSLCNKWSVNEAILTGDALIALSVKLASPYGETILKTVAQSALELCEGEHMDLVDSLRTTTEKMYFKKIMGKSASLCRAAAYCGAVAVGASSSEANALSMFGESFGMAYQLRDDILDFTSNEDANLKDLSGGRVTLPLIYCYANSTVEEKKKIEDLQKFVSQNSLKANEKSRDLLQIMRQKGAFEYCEKKIDAYLTQALNSVSTLKDSIYRTYLIEMARTLRYWADSYEQKNKK